MNLIKKWKNRETKKKLKEENIRLKAEIDLLHNISDHPVCTIERTVQKVRTRRIMYEVEDNIPADIIKHDLCRQMVDYIEQFVEFYFDDVEPGRKVYTATLYVATGDRKYG